jgi:5-methylthioribose kinase
MRTSVTSYFEFNTLTAANFAAPYLPGRVIDSREVGDGNLNRVFRVEAEHGSVVVKQALPYLKVAGGDWPLTRDRAKIERWALDEHGRLVRGMVPEVVHFDEDLSAIVLEDLREFRSWRDLLVSATPTPGVAAQIGRYCASVLLGTSHVVQSSAERKALRSRFGYSELCLVTEELVFTAPYTDAASNRFDPEIEPEAVALREDGALKAAVAELRYAFRTRDEALIHGDLHSGSVMVGPTVARVIDLEFAFFGPIGFDLGLLTANLALSAIAHGARGDRQFAHEVAGYAREFWDAFVDECRLMWQPTEPWFHRFMSGVLVDAARFAGLEMIRRVVGLAHVADIDSLEQPARLIAQRAAITGGRALVVGHSVTDFDELWLRATLGADLP